MKGLWMMVGLAVMMSAAGARAEDKATDDTPTRLKVVALRVQAVFATRAGEKSRSRVPYEFTCLTGSAPTSLRIGTEVPIAIKQTKEGERTDWQYRNVGTNIRCEAKLLDDGRYRVSLNFEQSSIHTAEAKLTGAQPDVPLFNTWVLVSGDIYKDGQTIQSALGTDPNSGESATLDVTVKVMK